MFSHIVGWILVVVRIIAEGCTRKSAYIGMFWVKYRVFKSYNYFIFYTEKGSTLFLGYALNIRVNFNSEFEH